MSRIVLLAAVLALLAPLSPPLSAASAAPAADERRRSPLERAAGEITLDGVRVKLRRSTRQVVTVNRTSGHHARVTFWGRFEDGWREVMTAADGRIGYGGLVKRTKRKQGTGTTPLGTFDLPFAFGMHDADEDWRIRYREVRRGDYWVQDNRSDHYNRYRSKSRGGFRWWLPNSHRNSSERLLDYRDQYEWAVVMDFNWEQVRRRGSGIFLHVNGSGATAGCVSAPRRFIRRVMNRLDPDRRPVVAVGR